MICIKFSHKQHYIGAWIFSENPATGPKERWWEMSVVYICDDMHGYMYSNYIYSIKTFQNAATYVSYGRVAT